MQTIGHADRSIDKELHALQEHLQKMGQLVSAQLQLVQKAAQAPDAALRSEARTLDKEINQLEHVVEEAVMAFFARHQPLMAELRLVTFSIKLVALLERLGDLSKNSVRRLCQLKAALPATQNDALQAMAREVHAMLQGAMALLARFDVAQIHAVIQLDTAVDTNYKALKKSLRAELEAATQTPELSQRVRQIGRNLERAGDFAVDIACIVYFIYEGKRLHKKDIA